MNDDAHRATESTLALVEGVSDLAVSRPPEVVLEEARKAARALKDVIDAKPKKVVFNNETYLEFEDWQTVGRFYGISPRIVATKYVEYGETRGFKATADAIHVATSRVVASAEAMCLTDEPHWRIRPVYEWHYIKKSGGTSKEDPGREELIWEDGPAGKKRPKRVRVLVGEEPVPLFQLRSMAQTRAGAKALRNALAWVVVLAGYKPTPAEELPSRVDDVSVVDADAAEEPRRSNSAHKQEVPASAPGGPEWSQPAAQENSTTLLEKIALVRGKFKTAPSEANWKKVCRVKVGTEDLSKADPAALQDFLSWLERLQRGETAAAAEVQKILKSAS